ncbi:MAG: UDP-galactopyranose mutase [Clostridia bacterium]|nr:UDP-galactopyranose mutase [Clostridia bacterium]
MVIPLVVSPYLTRTLGDTSLGIYSYTYSIAYYFVIFAMLGIARHGQRIIAQRKDDETALRKTFWSLLSVHSLFSVMAILAYVLFAVFGGGEYKSVYLIQTLYVASALFDITWLFYGLENFKSVVIRNLIIKIVECILVFCLVKSSEDLWIYTLVLSSSLFLGQAVMLPQVIFKIKPIKFGWVDVKEHFKPLFVLFIAVVASTLYTVFDKTLLGAMTNKENVAYYEYSNKIITIPKTIITVIGTVMFPRACACIAKGDNANAKRYMNYSLQFTSFVGMGSIFGLLGIANLLVVLYYGESFAICGDVIIALSPAVFIIGLGDIIRNQYLIPNHKDKIHIVCLALNAVINLILTFSLIPVLGIYGAVIGTLSAELCGLCFLLVVSRKFLPIKTVLLSILPYAVGGAIMFGVIYVIRLYFNSSWLHLILQMLVGGGLYCVLGAVYLFTLSPIKNEFKKFIYSKLKLIGIKKIDNGETAMKKYDYLVVGAGLFGAVFAHEAVQKGKKVLVIDKRPNIAGNVYTEEIEGINVHKYGAHIFHTNNKEVWNYVNKFAEFNRFTNSPVANYKGELYSLPFNMYTFNKMWGVTTPEEAEAKIKAQREEAGITEPKNLEEQAISLVGKDIYEKLVKGYTEKQWGRSCTELPAFIIKRLPVRFTFDNNYFNALYQGIPVGGYTKMVENMLDGIEVRLNCDYLANKAELDKLAKKVVYTGAIDAYFDFKLGALEYRSVRFETEVLDKPNFQGNAAVNYTDRETSWTRIIEHKWFEFGNQPKTVISREYSSEWKLGDEPYYPVNDEKNGKLYEQYKQLAEAEKNVIFGGRLGEYKYYDMDAVIASALDLCDKEL